MLTQEAIRDLIVHERRAHGWVESEERTVGLIERVLREERWTEKWKVGVATRGGEG